MSIQDQPLSEAAYQILLALVDEPRHGLGVAAEVEARTGGRVVLGAGTLYSAFRRMREDGWLRDVENPSNGGEPRRRYLELTEAGRTVLASEARRLETLVADARVKQVLPGHAAGG